jgi:hypothetical protein
MAIQLPRWHSGAEEQSVFSLSPKTICSAPASVLQVETQQTANLLHTLLYSRYTPGEEVVLTCTNYRNPLKAGRISGFRITLSDRETPQNLVAAYPAWSFTIDELEPQQLPAPLIFTFYPHGSDEPSAGPLNVQTDSGVSIEFNMGAVPVDDKGCFVKYTFPSDMPLPSTALAGGYLSSKEKGEQMMYSSANGINLQQDFEYFIRN